MGCWKRVKHRQCKGKKMTNRVKCVHGASKPKKTLSYNLGSNQRLKVVTDRNFANLELAKGKE